MARAPAARVIRAASGADAPDTTIGWPWRPLAGPLTVAQRRALGQRLEQLLGWQRTLEGWPGHRRQRTQGDRNGLARAVPFVSLYAGPRLAGCMGSDEGQGTERLERAFLRALEDPRSGRVTAPERARLAAEVSFLLPPRSVAIASAPAELEAGTHGLALLAPGAPPALLLPSVARHRQLGPKALLEALARKAGLAVTAWEAARARLFLFEAESVAARLETGRAGRTRGTSSGRQAGGREPAVAWLEALIDPSTGCALAGVDATQGQAVPAGTMHHGRSAVVLAALQRHGGRPGPIGRLARWLMDEITRALANRAVPAWPDDPARVAGTLALAVMAGLPFTAPLAERARDIEALAASPWHAGQVVTALGAAAPQALWRCCVANLERRPFAPWTALAARARGDHAVLERCVARLVSALREGGPHRGGAGVTEVPELALTALTVEALDGIDAPGATAAVERGRAFLRRWQLRAGRVPAYLDPALAVGAFPASPVALVLRADITAHAVLALAPSGPRYRLTAS
jgi:AMMECR1 domain-containing protein